VRAATSVVPQMISKRTLTKRSALNARSLAVARDDAQRPLSHPEPARNASRVEGSTRSDLFWGPFENYSMLAMPLERKPRVAISLRVERDVIDWFKAQAGPYQSRMHAVLKAFVEAHQHAQH
jgi:uncharacterized protein (DUF4415 family)